MFSRFGAWSAVALLAVVALAGCGKTTSQQETPPTVTQVNVGYVMPTAGSATPTAVPGSGTSATVAATQPSGGAQAASVDLEDIMFSVNTLTAAANAPFTIHVKNVGATVHNFNIDELKINSGDMAPGASMDVVVNAPAGSYTYYCNVPGHEAAGMKGTLTVTAGTPAGAAATPPPAAASSPAAATSPAAASPAAAAASQPMGSPSATLASPAAASPSAATPTAATPGSAASPAAASVSAAAPLAVELQDIKFSTDALSAPANVATTIHITNSGSIVHNFNIDNLKINTGDMQPGASVDVVVTAPAGTYTYYCNIPGHEAAGMKGVLTVS